MNDFTDVLIVVLIIVIVIQIIALYYKRTNVELCMLVNITTAMIILAYLWSIPVLRPARETRRDLTITTPTVLNFTVSSKTPSNPLAQSGSTLCYYMNSKEQPILALRRGVPYTFINDSTGHPLYFTTDSKGDANGMAPIAGAPPQLNSGSQVVTFDDNYPNEFYYQLSAGKPIVDWYQCALHPNMGNSIILSSGLDIPNRYPF